MKFFSCSVCAEKNQRIADLKSEIEYLRAQVAPSNDPNRTPAVHMEADGVLSGQQHIIEIPPAEYPADPEYDEQSERDRILSGAY